jgi:tetratricopeptide (TPR) repeat protein
MEATAYYDLPTDMRDERNEYLDKAIYHYKRSLLVFTADNKPEYWGAVVTGLGDAYQDYNPGDPTKYLNWAIECYQSALKVYTETDYPELRAKTFTSMSDACAKMQKIDRANNIRNAMQSMRGALKFYTEESHPEQFAARALTMARLNVELGKLTNSTTNITDACNWYRMAIRVHKAEEDEQMINQITNEVRHLSGEFPQLGIH